MDAVLQNFRRSFGPTTPFFHSLSLDPPTTMEELYKRADKYSTLEDNIWAASQTVMITAQSSKLATKGQPEQKGARVRTRNAPETNQRERESPRSLPLSTSLTTDSFRSFGITPTLNGPHPFNQIPHSATSL